MIFIETGHFQKRRAEHLTDEQFRELQNEIMGHPERGALIRGSGGLRKLRSGTAGRGKSGGVRVIYYFLVRTDTIYLLDLYAKNEKADLTPAEIREINKRMRG